MVRHIEKDELFLKAGITAIVTLIIVYLVLFLYFGIYPNKEAILRIYAPTSIIPFISLTSYILGYYSMKKNQKTVLFISTSLNIGIFIIVTNSYYNPLKIDNLIIFNVLLILILGVLSVITSLIYEKFNEARTKIKGITTE